MEQLQDLARVEDLFLQNLASDKEFRSSTYLAKSASDKMSALWSEISKD